MPTDHERMERNGPVEQAAQAAHSAAQPKVGWRQLDAKRRNDWRKVAAAVLKTRGIFDAEEAQPPREA